jgi:hypothetical protein
LRIPLKSILFLCLCWGRRTWGQNWTWPRC